jgi:hypothetical protein
MYLENMHLKYREKLTVSN